VHNSLSSDSTKQIHQPQEGLTISLLNFPMTPYVLGIIVWMLAWWVQMGPARPLFNFAPGVELPFFPAGVRTLAVFAFGFPGAVGIFIGSLVTYFLYFPEMLGVSPMGTIGCAAASAFSSYVAMRLICAWNNIPQTLEGLTFKSISWIVITQSLLSASLHQFLYHSEQMSGEYVAASITTTLFNWGAMATGDALGSVAVLFAVLFLYQRYTRNR
jgi:hypothetical protein